MNQDYSKLEYKTIRDKFIKEFNVNHLMLDLIDYLEEHQAESLVRDFMEYQLTHYLIEEIPF